MLLGNTEGSVKRVYKHLHRVGFSCGVLCLLLLLLCAPYILAQEITGRISGVVRDASGANVPNATIMATHVETGATYSTKSTADGLYSFPTLPVGHYEVSAEASGFEKYIGRGLMLNVNEPLQLDISMKVGRASQTIDVTAQPAAVNTENATVGNLINGHQMTELPLNGRNFIGLTTLVPGTAPGSGFDTFDVGLLGGSALSVNGNASNGNLWLVNGVLNTDLGSNATLLVFPSVDAISEFTILRNNYSAQFGMAAGGVVNVITKSGTQTYHGSVFEFDRNDAFDAADFFINKAGLPKNELRYNNFGFTLGGPIFIPNRYNSDKTKDFFFWSEEWRKEVQGNTITMTVPSARQRQGILDPTCSYGSVNCVPQPPQADEIPLDEPNVPVSQINPNSTAELDRLPLPNTAGAPNFTASQPRNTNWREDMIQLDHYFTQSTTLMLNYIQDNWVQDNTTGEWGTAPNPTITSDWSQPSRSATARLTHTWNARMVSNFQFAYSDNYIDWTPSSTCPVSLCSRQGFDYQNIFPATNGLFPSFLGTGDGISPVYIEAPYNNRTDTTEVGSDFNYTVGKHQLTMGGAYYALRKPAPATAFNGTAGEVFANSLYDFLLGDLATYSQYESLNMVQTRWRDADIYVQDNYKLKPNLTLNLGLRWQLLGQPYAANSTVANFFPGLYSAAEAPQLNAQGNVITGTGNSTNGLVLATSPGSYSRSLVQNHYDYFEPRLGFAYDPFGTGKFVLRGGGGIYHMQDSVDHLVNLGQNPPFNFNAVLSNTTWSAIGPISPGTPEPPPTLAALDYSRFAPVSYQYSFGFQVAPVKDTTLEVDYVGSYEDHLGVNRDINQVPAADQLLVGEGAAAALFRPYQGYGPIFENDWDGWARYNSLQVFLNHRLTHGVQLQAAYTWSHSIGDASNQESGAMAEPWQNAFSPRSEVGWTDVDLPQDLTVNYVWQLPFLENRKGFLGEALGRWEVTGIATLASGTPLNVCLPTDNAGVGATFLDVGGCERPDLVAPISYSKTPSEWFNPAAFAQPLVGTFGDAARDVVRGPGTANWDFAAYKNFQAPWLGRGLFGDTSQIQFRVELFNVLNHTQFSAVNTTFGTPGFGEPISVRSPRVMQLGLKLAW